MQKCKKYRSLFVQALYNELNDEQKQRFDSHLENCPKCTAEYHGFKMTLQVMEKRSRQEPESVFWSGYWNRLVGRMEKREPSRTTIISRWKRWMEFRPLPPNWALGTAAAVVLILIGVFIGKETFGPDRLDRPTGKGLSDISSQTARMTSIENRTQRYIQRSKVLLLGLVNFNAETEDPHALNLPQQQQISQNLIQEAGFLKENLKGSAEQQLLKLITDLEMILMQIANLEYENDLSAVELVKSGVDHKGILFKINLEEMRRTSEKYHAGQDNDKKKNAI